VNDYEFTFEDGESVDCCSAEVMRAGVETGSQSRLVVFDYAR